MLGVMMLGVMGMQQIAGVQVLSVQALRSQIASSGFRRGRMPANSSSTAFIGGTCARSERNWYA
jgi:hypothetical protein